MSWKFDAGHLALDFVNTLEWRGRESSDESLNAYSDLIEWAIQGKIFNESERDVILSKRMKDKVDSQSALEQARQFREGLYRIFSNVASGFPPELGDLELLQDTMEATMIHSKLEWKEDRLNWSWRAMDKPVERILWLVAQEAINLLSDDLLHRLGECADDRGCAYLFIDTTRNHSRKWCSMESCGNRAKAMRHYERRKKIG